MELESHYTGPVKNKYILNEIGCFAHCSSRKRKVL